MKISNFFLAILSAATYILMSVPANAAFSGRLETLPGSGIFQAYYDDQLNITWATDANINGWESWDNQMAWVVGLSIDGVSGWRLPSMDVNGDGSVVSCSFDQAACKDNEYAHLFYYGGGTTYGGGVAAYKPDPFINIQNSLYYSETEDVNDSTRAWAFYGIFMTSSNQGTFYKIQPLPVWAVYDGDVAAVPLPMAVWLFGSALLGLVGVARRKKAA